MCAARLAPVPMPLAAKLVAAAAVLLIMPEQGAATATAGNLYLIAGAANGTSGNAGDGGQATSALLDHPRNIAYDLTLHGNLAISDYFNHRVRYVDTASGMITVRTAALLPPLPVPKALIVHATVANKARRVATGSGRAEAPTCSVSAARAPLT